MINLHFNRLFIIYVCRWWYNIQSDHSKDNKLRIHWRSHEFASKYNTRSILHADIKYCSKSSCCFSSANINIHIDITQCIKYTSSIFVEAFSCLIYMCTVHPHILVYFDVQTQWMCIVHNAYGVSIFDGIPFKNICIFMYILYLCLYFKKKRILNSTKA